MCLPLADNLDAADIRQLLQLPEAQHLLHLMEEPNVVENHEKPSPQVRHALEPFSPSMLCLMRCRLNLDSMFCLYRQSAPVQVLLALFNFISRIQRH